MTDELERLIPGDRDEVSQPVVRHILSLSGGKDSTALALFMRDEVPGMEYVFCDTGEELPETYEYLERLEAYLWKPIVRLNPDRPFSHYLHIYRVLPDARTRWCTRKLKIEPFERYVGNDRVMSYIAIRADEAHRTGYISTKPNIAACYPLIEDGLTATDVGRILEESRLGLPSFYNWRSRSGCYFCFFQQRIEWVGLLENHRDYYRRAQEYESENSATGEMFTWVDRESLAELAHPDRVREIKEEFRERESRIKRTPNAALKEVLGQDDDETACTICRL